MILAQSLNLVGQVNTVGQTIHVKKVSMIERLTPEHNDDNVSTLWINI